MKIHKHISQGTLLHTCLDEDNSCSDEKNYYQDKVTVVENEYFRWIAFDDVIQSVMNKRKPWLLTLPHQNAMMFPLLFFKPNKVVELGLGGGNFQRFIHHLAPEATMHSIEHNNLVIDCFNQYFNPAKLKTHVVYQDSNLWLLSKDCHEYDWFICDIYQQHLASYDSTVKQFSSFTAHINNQTCLTINMPEASDSEIGLCLMLLKELFTEHHIFYFHIPNYLNIVIHLIPKQWNTSKLLKRNKQSYLPDYLFSKWRGFWQTGKSYK